MSHLPDAASPLYEKVKDYILQNIGAGVWTRHQRLPSENDFVSRLGVSRMTVHRALRELTTAGILVRIQGVGTFVAVPKPQAALLEIRNIAEEIKARGHTHRSEVLALESRTTKPDLTAPFEFARARRVFHSIVIHFENDVPVQYEERFVNPDLAPDFDRQDFTVRTTYDYLTQTCPITEVEHVISAISADAAIAKHLRIAVAAPCLLLYRRTWSGVAVATVNRLIYVGERFSLGSRYRPVVSA